jgi:hypothetical protein
MEPDTCCRFTGRCSIEEGEERVPLAIIIVQYCGSESVLSTFFSQPPSPYKIVQGRPAYLIYAGDVCLVDTEGQVTLDFGLLARLPAWDFDMNSCLMKLIDSDCQALPTRPRLSADCRIAVRPVTE